MKSKKNNRNYLMAVIALLFICISVGYAALSTSLNIKGTSTIKTQSWDVHFENVNKTEGSVAASKDVTITSPTELSYSVDLTQPGDYYEFTVDVKNSGSIDAKLNSLPLLSGVSSEQDIYTNYIVTYEDGSTINANDTLATNETKTIKVKVEFDRNITQDQLPTENQMLDLTFTMEFVQA